ncbi:MAG: MarR family winged helix-turn-helix transcriptional regulator [Mariniblastus sp.]
MERYIDRSLGFAIARARHLIQTELKKRIAESGLKISPEESSVLLIISDATNPIRVSDLARLAIRDITTLKRQIDSLVGNKYVRQEKDPADGRGVLVSLTDLGREEILKLEQVVDSVRAKVTKGFSKKEHAQLIASMKKIQANLLD